MKGFFSKTECKKLIRSAKVQRSAWLTLKDEKEALKKVVLFKSETLIAWSRGLIHLPLRTY
tara:strand:- start:2233 stop:2415 length:183 start_codon:yes stop_codon:yes gene_type:complete